jgi:hypothetical protein
MKRILSTIVLAAPLAIVALSLGSAPAMAEPDGPASDQITSTKLGPVNPHLPEDPQEENPQNDPDPEPDPDEPDLPDVPDDKVANPTPCGTPEDRPKDPPEEEEEPTPGILAELEPADEDEDEPDDEVIPRPNCIDAGAGASDAGMELGWLMVSSGLITATGSAFAVRRRIRTEA